MIITMPESDVPDAEVRSYNCTVQDMIVVGDSYVYCCTWDDEDSHGAFLIKCQNNTWTMSNNMEVQVMT